MPSTANGLDVGNGNGDTGDEGVEMEPRAIIIHDDEDGATNSTRNPTDLVSVTYSVLGVGDEVKQKLERKEGITIDVDNGSASALVRKSSLERKIETVDSDTGGEVSLATFGKNDPNAPIYEMHVKTLMAHLKTDINIENPKNSKGLSADEAKARLDKDGFNELTPPPTMSEWQRLLWKFIDPFFGFLMIAGALCFMGYGVQPNDSGASSYYQIGIVLFGSVAISGLFAFWQEGKASAVMKSFKNLLPKQARVIRDGHEQSIPARELVVGDIVHILTGDQVPADVRILYCQEMKIEKSALTGESLPVACSVGDGSAEKIEEATNIAFNTCPVNEGECFGVVYATGDRSMIGSIAGLASATDTELTPIQKEVIGFVKKLALAAGVLGIIFFAIALGRGRGVLSSFVNGFVVVIVAIIPEGLPLTVISCLAVTAKQMSMRNVFVKELRSVETLGSATVIASDKTGTITQNRMTVANFWFDGIIYPNASLSNISSVLPNFDPLSDHAAKNSQVNAAQNFSKTYNALELVMGLCNRAKFENERTNLVSEEVEAMIQLSVLNKFTGTTLSSYTYENLSKQNPLLSSFIKLDPGKTLRSTVAAHTTDNKDDKRKVIGDGSDKAFFDFVKLRQRIELLRYFNRVVFELPFNSRNKFAITIVKPHEKKVSNHKRVLLMKGAPEVILGRCSQYMKHGEVFSVDEEFKRNYENAYEHFGGQGERVLGFAWKELDNDKFPPSFDSEYSYEKNNFPTSNLVFLGLVSLVDPPKNGVENAIASCKTAGIQVIMVTGDHPITAAAIARQVGIIEASSLTRKQVAQHRGCSPAAVPHDEYDAAVIEGKEIPALKEEEWDILLKKKEVVFARTTPAQKLEIVTHLQKLGHIVAVTGDGVNDSPALKKANIGVAMGINGSDVARDAADVILMDDDFSTIVEGIRYGRAIFDNLTKAVCYTVSHMAPETWPTLLSIAFDLPPALPALAILSIDCGSELAPAISFAYEAPESDVMQNPPRDPKGGQLFNLKTTLYVLFIGGGIETLLCYMIYLQVFNYYGIGPSHLAWTSNFWTSTSDPYYLVGNNCTPKSDSCQFYTGDEQVDISQKAGGAYWWTLVMAQVFHIFMCKTRSASIFTTGFFDNAVMNACVLLEVALILFFIFTPTMNAVLVGLPFPPQFWPWFFTAWGALFLQAELRKWHGRKYPQGWLQKYINW